MSPAMQVEHQRCRQQCKWSTVDIANIVDDAPAMSPALKNCCTIDVANIPGANKYESLLLRFHCPYYLT